MMPPVGPGRSNGGGTEGESRRQPPGSEAQTTAHGPGPGRSCPSRIGPFRILGLIGEGAMGIVYEAEQEWPHRRVALKIVRPGMVPADVLRRFDRER